MERLGGYVRRCDAHCCGPENGLFYNLWLHEAQRVAQSSLKRDYPNPPGMHTHTHTLRLCLLLCFVFHSAVRLLFPHKFYFKHHVSKDIFCFNSTKSFGSLECPSVRNNAVTRHRTIKERNVPAKHLRSFSH